MTVMMPQSKAGLYHVSNELYAAVFSILCKLANCQPAIDLIARDGQLLEPQHWGHLGW